MKPRSTASSASFKYEPKSPAPHRTRSARPFPPRLKQERWNALMANASRRFGARRLKRKVGTRQQVIIDEVGPTVSKGRSRADAPGIDGAGRYLRAAGPCAST